MALLDPRIPVGHSPRTVSVAFHDLVGALNARGVRYLLIGVAGANYYGPGPAGLFVTRDRDLFLPLDTSNLLQAWHACESMSLDLTCSGEPLDRPRDEWLAKHVVAQRALTRASDGEELLVDLTLVMGDCLFDEVWQRRRTFVVEGHELPVASLLDIVTSKAAAGRPKDRLFFETHRDALREWLLRDFRPE